MHSHQSKSETSRTFEPITATCPVCGKQAETWEGRFRIHGTWLACRGSERPVPALAEGRAS